MANHGGGTTAASASAVVTFGIRPTLRRGLLGRRQVTVHLRSAARLVHRSPVGSLRLASPRRPGGYGPPSPGLRVAILGGLALIGAAARWAATRLPDREPVIPAREGRTLPFAPPTRRTATTRPARFVASAHHEP